MGVTVASPATEARGDDADSESSWSSPQDAKRIVMATNMQQRRKASQGRNQHRKSLLATSASTIACSSFFSRILLTTFLFTPSKVMDIAQGTFRTTLLAASAAPGAFLQLAIPSQLKKICQVASTTRPKAS